MQAWFLERYGTPERNLVLREQAAAAPGRGEVAVRVEAVSLNPVDLKTVQGESKLILPMKPPFVVGVDFAGVVEALGEGVSGVQPGERVIAYTGMAAMGAFAERVVVPAQILGRAPMGWSMAEAATLPLPALCAQQSLDAAGLQRGQRLLVHGGGGAVGSLAVQLAARRGAVVVATAGPRDVERVRALGASVVVDYTASRFESVTPENDVVFDTVGGETLARSFGVVKRGGKVVSLHGAPSVEAMRAAGLRPPWFLGLLLPLVGWGSARKAKAAGAQFLPQITVPDGAALSAVSQLDIAKSPIDQCFSFAELPAAFARLSSGQARGRICLVRSAT
ncbi:MAG TPA: NADP-dependent oxidoreductase [Myxococcota bacterium]|nr:NADP-dependent oxidoreductase [Myxococcota bacterium]